VTSTLALLVNFLFALSWVLGLVTAWQVILGRRRGASATMGWVVILLVMPIVGLVAYYFFGRRRLKRTRSVYKALRSASAAETGPATSRRHLRQQEALEEIASGHRLGLVHLAERVSTRPLTGGNLITIYTHGGESLDAIHQAIAGARHHVHLEYYIFRPDGAGRRMLHVLESVARRGVKVRLLVDDVGSGELHRRDTRALIQAGGEFARFNPVLGARALHHVQLRNHRKIVVVDGETCFTGSQNVGDEYAGARGRLGTWRDTHLRIRGPATASLQQVFWDDWRFATGERSRSLELFPDVETSGDQWVHVVDSGPDIDSSAIHYLLFSAIATAERSVDLVTPYFIPDPALVESMQAAALRGVQVRLLVPGRSDSALVTYAGRWYYDELLETGVKIWEYQRGMLHAKTAVVDGWWSVVGTANMDQRSFFLNFEVNTVLYGHAAARRLSSDFESDLHYALPITLAQLHRMPRRFRIYSAFARMLSPLL
jgi:cardiolipin synthase A/B